MLALRRRSPIAVAALAVAGTVLAGLSAGHVAAGPHSGWQSGPKEFLWTKGYIAKHEKTAPPTSPGQSQNLIFHGGAVQHSPKVYLIFWGTEWKKGFRVGPGYTQKTAMNYETQFFANVGGSPWAGVQTQFCDGIAPGSVTCKGDSAAKYVTNPKRVLHGVWVDSSPVPASMDTTGLVENVSHDPVASEALKAAAHFQTSNVDALFMVFTPPGHAATAYGSVYCAYHSEVTPSGGTGHGIRYAFMPFTPEQGAGCGGNSVNKVDNKFGNGYFDSYTLAGGHEWGEAVTDPDAWPTQDGWNDYQTSENGDKCAYQFTKDIKLGRHQFAVQPMYSNEANGGSGGCADRRGTGKFPAPSPLPV